MIITSNYFKENEKFNTETDFNGEVKYEYKPLNIKKLYLLEDPHQSKLYEDLKKYEAKAMDEDGNVYRVLWNMYDSENGFYYDEDGDCVGKVTDFSNACDWTEYTIEKIEGGK